MFHGPTDVPRMGAPVMERSGSSGNAENGSHLAGQMPQRAMQGRWRVQVAAETPKTAHTWQRWVPQRAMQGRWTVRVAAETRKTAHTWQRRTSAMSPVRYCGGTPHRTVQNQVVCRTGRPRRTVRYRKRSCGVRELILAPGRTRRWQQRRSSCRTGGGRKRELVADSSGAGAAEVHDGEVAAEQDNTKPDSSGGG